MPEEQGPRCFSLLVVRNEADIIEASIRHLAGYSHKVFVLDNGSTDGTAEIIAGLRSDRVVDLGVYRGVFFINLRCVIWRLLRGESAENDWWHLADADEFMQGDVVGFLRRVPLDFGVVMKADVYPVPVPSQREAFGRLDGFDPSFFTHYHRSDWSEARFFRNTRQLRLHPETLRFSRLRAVFPEPLPALHYPWRSGAQIESRIRTRQEARRRQSLRPHLQTSFGHVRQQRWEDIFEHVMVKTAIPMAGEVLWPDRFRNWAPHAPGAVLRRQARRALYRLGLV